MRKRNRCVSIVVFSLLGIKEFFTGIASFTSLNDSGVLLTIGKKVNIEELQYLPKVPGTLSKSYEKL